MILRNKIISIIICTLVCITATSCNTNKPVQNSDNLRIKTVDKKTIVTFKDAYGGIHDMTLNSEAELIKYDKNNFVREGEKMRYKDNPEYTYRLGIDVSEHQGVIDWNKVKSAGYDFAIIRIAYRGYTEGGLFLDATYKTNIEGALAAGLDVGVYVFSQAITTQEALEEATLALEHVRNYKITCPIVYDPETISSEEARTKDLSKEQITENTIAFCEKVKEAGYTPMIYSNMMWEAYQFDLTKLSIYDFWYADYEPKPQTPYHFIYWQYDENGTVPGIEGSVDLNIQMIPNP